MATLPSASAKGAGAEIFVADGLGGRPGIAASDGTSWLRSDTGTPINWGAALSDTEVAALYHAFAYYLDAIGAI